MSDASKADLPLPPGRTGWPLIGETLPFLRDAFGFVDQRIAEHGAVFRTRILGQDVAVFAGPEAAALFIDEDLIQRDGAAPAHVQELLGGGSLGVLDGSVHKMRKQQVLAGFTNAALAGYVPAMQAAVDRALGEALAAGEIQCVETFKRLALEVISTNVFGMGRGADLDALVADFAVVTGGFTGLPIDVRATAYGKAVAAKNRIFALLGRYVEAHRRDRPSDGLTLILDAHASDGSAITDENVVKELHHIFIAGYIIFSEFTHIVAELAAHPDVRRRLRDEVQAHSPDGPITPRALAAMPELSQLVSEIKRIAPVVPAVFGKAKRDFEYAGHRIPKGWLVYWGLRASNHDAKVFASPEKFDPARFSPARDEAGKHPHAFAPQGAGPATGHKCPGTDYATLFMQVFTIVLLRGYDWDLPSQNLSLDWGRIPPEHGDGLRARFRSRSAGALASVSPRLSGDVLVALASIAWADGVVTDDEKHLLLEVARVSELGKADLDRVTRALDERGAALDTARLGAEERTYVLALATWLARVDGRVTTQERQAIASAAQRWGATAEEIALAEAAGSAIEIAGDGPGLARLLRELAPPV